MGIPVSLVLLGRARWLAGRARWLAVLAVLGCDLFNTTADEPCTTFTVSLDFPGAPPDLGAKSLRTNEARWGALGPAVSYKAYDDDGVGMELIVIPGTPCGRDDGDRTTFDLASCFASGQGTDVSYAVYRANPNTGAYLDRWLATAGTVTIESVAGGAKILTFQDMLMEPQGDTRGPFAVDGVWDETLELDFGCYDDDPNDTVPPGTTEGASDGGGDGDGDSDGGDGTGGTAGDGDGDGECRTFATAKTLTLEVQGMSFPGQETCSFDGASLTYACTVVGTDGTTTTVRTYSSLGDFVAEGAAVGTVRVARVDTTGDTTPETAQVYNYDGEGRPTGSSTEQTGAGEMVRTEAFTAWDAAGRPTAGIEDWTLSVQSCAGREVGFTYDDGARTSTFTASGGTGPDCVALPTRITGEFDADHILVRAVTTASGVDQVATFVVDSTDTVCLP